MKRIFSAILAIVMLLTVLPMSVWAVDAPTLTVGTISGKAGDTVSVDVVIANNPGIFNIEFLINFDNTKVTLNSQTDGTVGLSNKNRTTIEEMQTAGSYRFFADTGNVVNNTNNGVLVTLSFTINRNCTTDIELVPVLNPEEALNIYEESVGFTVITGKIALSSAPTPVTEITLDKTELTLTEGETGSLTATVTPDNATDKTVTWTSSDTAVATVENGTVTAVKAGRATITAKAGDKTAVCEVTVSAKTIAVESITLDKNALILTEGDTAELTATVSPDNATDKSVTWTSSNTAVATVENGTVTAVGKGTAVITAATVGGEFTATCQVTVKVPVTGVTLNKTTTTIEQNKTETLIAAVAPTDASNTNVTWKSSDESVATVVNGVVTAVAEGEATITVTTEDGGYTASCKVTVPHTVHTKDETKWEHNETYHWRACAGCDIHLDEAEHSGGKATCTAQAVCTDCGQPYGKFGTHDSAKVTKTDAKDETCTEAGNIAYWTCGDCDKIYSDEALTEEIELEDTVIPAAHKVDKNQWVTNEEKHWHACTGGDGTCTYVEDAAAHTFEWKIDQEATEDQGGRKHEECTVCGCKRSENTEIPKLPHTHSMTYVPAKDPTCSEKGVKEHWICSKADYPDCAGTFADEAGNIPLSETTIPVDSSKHVNTTVINQKPATAEEEGYTGDTYCNDCKTTIAYGKPIDKITHVCSPADEWSSDDTYHWHRCYDKNCDEIMDKAAHTASKWIADNVHPIRYKECTVCGYVLEIDQLKNPLADDFDWYYWYTAVRAARSYTITASAGKGGEISPSGITTIKNGGNLTLEITPDEGYAIEMVKVDGIRRGALDEYTFRNIASNHRIEVTFKKLSVPEKEPAVDVTEESVWENPFYDIFETDEYYEAVRFVYEMDLFVGESEHMFAPETTMNRAMFVTVLGRLDGVDTSDFAGTSFEDVPEGQWYSEYVEWAAQSGIVEGYGNGKFGPMDLITVEQAAVIIGRYVRYTGISTEVFYENLEDYADAELVSHWAKDAVNWTVEAGIYDGEGDLLNPQAEAPRALVAEMLYELVLWMEEILSPIV